MRILALLLLPLACATMTPALALAGPQPHCRVGTPAARVHFDAACALLEILDDDRCCTAMMLREMDRVLLAFESELGEADRHDRIRVKREAIHRDIQNRVAP
jgi:hypothetical protein